MVGCKIQRIVNSVLVDKNIQIKCDVDPYLPKLEELSRISYRTYRDLVYETPNFVSYFKQATPIEFIQNLNLGSRPSKRKDTQRVETCVLSLGYLHGRKIDPLSPHGMA